ncbi:hypothetical protein EV714DRAFT_245982 [Schizophyllum commune]
MGAGLDSTLGAAFIGMVIAAAYTYFYFGSTSRQNKDSTLLSSIVRSGPLPPALPEMFISSAVYNYCVTEFGNLTALSNLPWPFKLFVTFTVQGFYVWRIWQCMSILLVEACSVAQADYITASFVTVVSAEELTIQLQKYVVLVNGLGAGTDILITLCMMALLKQSRTAIKRTNRIIRTIVSSCFRGGVETSRFCAIMVLSMAVAFPGRQIMMAFYFMLTKVYTNSLLGTLNVRDHLREASERAKWISTASFMFTRTRDIMGTTNNGPVRTTQGAHTVHELGDLKQDPSSQEESGDDIERQTISIKVDQSRDVTQ